MSDGAVVIEFNAETSDAQKEIDNLKEKVKSLESEQKETAKAYNAELKNRDRLYDRLQKKQAAYAAAQKRTEMALEQQSPVVQEIETTKAKIAEAETEVKKYREAWLNGVASADKDQSAAQQTVDSLKERLAELTKEAEKYDKSILSAAENEERLKVEVEQAETAWSNAKHAVRNVAESQDAVKQKLNDAKKEAGKLEKELLAAGENTGKMAEGVKKANKSADKFAARLKSVIRSALVFTVITQALSKFREWIGDVVKVTPEASAAVAKLKGALLTMVQPLVNVIIPAFTTLVNVLTAVIGKLAQFFSFLAGTSAESSAQAAEALNEQTRALNGTGSAAKKASKSLASFDEINKLSSSNESGGGNEAITPDFSGGDIDFLSNRVAALAEDIKAIFSDVKSFVSNIFSGDWDDAIQNIFDFCNDVSVLFRDLLSAADEIFGDMIDKIIEKFDLAETPIGEMLEGIKGMVHNTVEMINAVANGSFSDFLAALAGFVDSLRTFVNGAVDFVKKVINSLLDWLDDKTNGRLGDIIGTVRLFVNGMIEAVKRMFNGLTDFLVGAFTGDWDRALNGLYDIFAGFLNGAITVVEGAINIIITAINWVTSQINSLLSIDVPDWVPVFGGKSWSPNIQPIPLKQLDRIPALAQGAVIPPNREFLAVLGDQKSGTNIETPLPTMIQAFKQALAESNYSGKSEAYLMLDDIQLGKVIYRLNKSESNRIGVSLVEV